MTENNVSQPSASTLKTNVFNESYLYSVNRDSFNKVSAHVIFEADFSKTIFKENSLYIFIGTDSGLLPKYIQKQGIPSGSRYLFIEPEHILSELHQHHLLAGLDAEIICTTYEEWEEKADNLKIEQYSYINSVSLFSAICAQQHNSEDYAELNWQVTETLQTIQWKYSIQLATETFIQRQIDNVCDAHLPAKLFENAFQGQTVIILAGGPSLNEVLPWVKDNQEDLIIFSVSRISKILITANIIPDFIFSVDPQKISFDVSHEMLQFSDHPILIHANHIYPGLLNQWQGTNLYLGQRLPWKSELNIENLSSTGPTVTNTAIKTAHYFGFDTILLAGVDLCYSKKGITHAQGSAEQLAGTKYNTTSLQVETFGGEYRETGEDYYFALKTLEQQALLITKDNHRKIINLAKNAAKAEGISHSSADAIKLAPRALLPSIVADTKNKSRQKDSLTNYYQQLITELNKTSYQIASIEKIALKANQINNSMYINGIIENYKDKKKLDKIEKTLNTKYRPFSKLVKNFGVRQFIKITTPHDDDKEWEAEQVQELGKTYYDAYQDGAQKLSKTIKQAITRTKSRLEETKETPDFQLLLSFWDKELSYKRAEVWKKQHPDIPVCKETDQQFQLFSAKFSKYVQQSDIDLKSTMAIGFSNITFFKNKAKILFTNKRLEELKGLNEKFLSDDKNKEQQDYLCLISAYIAELEDDNSSALDYYNQILNVEGTLLLEDALTRIVNITIDQQNHQDTFLALECLTQISPIYLPFYAESASLLGDTILAIDSYIAYINFFPNDVVVQLKLASLYLSNKVYDGAELMLNHILSNSPNLEAALTLKKQLTNDSTVVS